MEQGESTASFLWGLITELWFSSFVSLCTTCCIDPNIYIHLEPVDIIILNFLRNFVKRCIIMVLQLCFHFFLNATFCDGFDFKWNMRVYLGIYNEYATDNLHNICLQKQILFARLELKLWYVYIFWKDDFVCISCS